MGSETVDVVVVGSGVAGLSAAIEAATCGARVTVLEAQSTLGGASIISGGGCCIVGTPLQQKQGIVDSVELALADWEAQGGPTVDSAWARKYLHNSKTDVFDWMEQLGIRWVSLWSLEGNSVPRWHEVEGYGRNVVERLIIRATSLQVEFRCNSTVGKLQVDDGAVRGVHVQAGTSEYPLRCSSVIVCTGGFTANMAKLLDWAPQLQQIPRVLSGGGVTSQGVGHDILRAVDAQFCHPDHIWVYPNATPDPTNLHGHRGLGIRFIQGDIWLNQQGRRFHNEALKGGKSGTPALLAQPSQTAWMVFHGREIERMQLINNPAYFPPPLGGESLPRLESFWRDSPHAVRATSIQELAALTNLPLNAVTESIEAFNVDVRAGLDKDSVHGRPLGGATVLDSDLAAVQLFPMAQKTFGGAQTDLECRVLDRTGRPIPGLFAAGEVAGMAGGCINGRAALEGTMYGPCLYSGRVAGQTAGNRSKSCGGKSVSHSGNTSKM